MQSLEGGSIVFLLVGICSAELALGGVELVKQFNAEIAFRRLGYHFFGVRGADSHGKDAGIPDIDD